MNLKELSEISLKYRKMNIADAFNQGDEIINNNDRVGEYMNEVSKKAQGLILERVDEEEVVRAITTMCCCLTTDMYTQGSVSPLKFLISGDMEAFVHTIVFSVIGMLIEEEIL